MKKSKRNDEDKHSIDELFQRSLKFKNTKEYLDFFRFIGKILHYSHYNATLVYMQNQNVKYFGTPGYWKKEFKRKVKPDARPYVIIVPFGPAALAYDVYETEGDVSPDEFINAGFRGELFKVYGDLPEELLREIINNLAEYKVFVRHKHFRFNKAGETFNDEKGTINIDITNELNTAQKFSTLIHELAHNFLGHLGNNELIKETVITKGTDKGKKKQEKIVIEGRTVSSDMQEIEAETVAFLICSRWNLENNPYEYLSYHLTEENIKQISVETIINVADEIERKFLAKFR